MKRIRTFLILTVFLLSLTGNVFAAGASTEQQVAADYLREAGIMVGDTSGDKSPFPENTAQAFQTARPLGLWQ